MESKFDFEKWIIGCSDTTNLLSYQKQLIKTMQEQEKQYMPLIIYDEPLNISDLEKRWKDLEYETTSFLNIEEMSLSQLKDKMKELNKKINHSKNPMEKKELQKELGKCSKRLGLLKNRNA